MSDPKPIFRCPSCNSPLSVVEGTFQTHDDKFPGVLVACVYGPCRSEVADRGAIAFSVAEAFDTIAAGFAAEQYREEMLRAAMVSINDQAR